jgi:hypothetical protein
MGDPENYARYVITVNGNELAAKYLEKNEYLTAMAPDVDGFGGLITVGAKCIKNCRYVWSRMSAVEIQKLNGPAKLPDGDKTERLGCGIAYMKGRCDKGKNVLNCVWTRPTDYGIRFCDSENQIVKIPTAYQCKAQHGMFKCIKSKYSS